MHLWIFLTSSSHSVQCYAQLLIKSSIVLWYIQNINLRNTKTTGSMAKSLLNKLKNYPSDLVGICASPASTKSSSVQRSTLPIFCLIGVTLALIKSPLWISAKRPLAIDFCLRCIVLPCRCNYGVRCHAFFHPVNQGEKNVMLRIWKSGNAMQTRGERGSLIRSGNIPWSMHRVRSSRAVPTVC